MTRNQIDYVKHLETVRSNKAQEAIELDKLRETQRSNMVSEAETRRSNKTRERELHRSNFAQERENLRSHMASEAIETSKIAEGRRHNQAMEFQTSFLNTETQRHNLIAEYQNSFRVTEEQRHNYANEEIDLYDAATRRQQINENVRHNMASESISGISASAARTSAAAAYLNAQTRISELGETIVHNRNVESETQRHNEEMELVASDGNYYDYDVGTERNKIEKYNSLWKFFDSVLPG